jgi:hypothetical protein
MAQVDELRRMLAGLYRQLAENSEAICRVNDRRQELERERIKIYDGIVGIQNELKRMEDDE